jgi:hypothetical protein
MKDLKVLESENEYIEFFSHIKDILPSKRNKEWKELVSRVAQSYLSSEKLVQNISEAQFKHLEDISSHKVLKEDEFFNKKYDKVILSYFGECFILGNKRCEHKVRSFLKRRPPSKTLGIEIAKLLYDQKITNNLISFIMPMAKSNIGEFYCGKSPTAEILIDRLYKEKDLHKMISQDCLKALTKRLNANLLTQTGPGTSAHIRHLTYELLKSSDNLNPHAEEKYLIIQLIEGFNLDSEQTLKTYRLLKKLSNSSERREKILSFLRMQIPLFGKVFSQKTKAAKAIIKGLNRHMPEYIDHYATTCLNHLSGKQKTPGGNPATYCHQFFSRAKQMNIIPTAKIDSYKKIMNY